MRVRKASAPFVDTIAMRLLDRKTYGTKENSACRQGGKTVPGNDL